MFNESSVIAVTCLALEARIAQGPGISVICSHGRDLIPRLEAAISRGAAGIISFGVAGGLAPCLKPGDFVVGEAILTDNQRLATDETWRRRLLRTLSGAISGDILGEDAPVATIEDKRRLHYATGALAVDMESHIAAGVANKHSIPFAACRVIIDAHDRNLPPAALVGLRRDGTSDLAAVCRSVLRYPWQLPELLRTAGDAQVAQSALSRGRARLGPFLAFAQTTSAAGKQTATDSDLAAVLCGEEA